MKTSILKVVKFLAIFIGVPIILIIISEFIVLLTTGNMMAVRICFGALVGLWGGFTLYYIKITDK